MLDLRIPSYEIQHGNNLDLIRSLPDNSIDSIVTDPPYEIAFMSGSVNWDNTGQAYNLELWRECLRVLKPGGHLIAFGATRTIHRTTSAIEDAGFEIRDMINWLYFSGFPKSHNVSKAIDKHFGAEREVLSERETNFLARKTKDGQIIKGDMLMSHQKGVSTIKITEPATDEAKKWDGWGTALKPSYEPAILARKPLQESNIARQVLATGTGAINIDECRFGYNDPCWVGPQEERKQQKTTKNPNHQHKHTAKNARMQKNTSEYIIDNWSPLGRWPANIYQCPKASRREREQGLEHLKAKTKRSKMNLANGTGERFDGQPSPELANFHPTVKPLKLMRWLCRLVTPKGGRVLDPFSGSGTTLAAAILEGFDCLGMELTEEYIPIIDGRCKWAIDEYQRENAQLSFSDWLEG